MDGGEEHNIAIRPKAGERRPEVGKAAQPVRLQPGQQETGGAENAGVEVEVLGGTNHSFWPISQFTYM